MNIAIFGGSFNPVHIGHFEIVRQINMLYEFDRILVVPAYKNPLKENLPSIPEDTRKKMLLATFAELKNVEISFLELQRGQISYTIATLEHYLDVYPGAQFSLLLGEDAFLSFHLWAKADRILELSNLIIFHRPALIKPESHYLSPIEEKRVTRVNLKIPDVSATDVRSNSLETIIKHQWLHPTALPIWEQYLKSEQQ